MQSGSLRASPHLFTGKSRIGGRVSDCILSEISRKSNIDYDQILNFDTCRTPAVTVSSPEDEMQENPASFSCSCWEYAAHGSWLLLKRQLRFVRPMRSARIAIVKSSAPTLLHPWPWRAGWPSNVFFPELSCTLVQVWNIIKTRLSTSRARSFSPSIHSSVPRFSPSPSMSSLRVKTGRHSAAAA